MYVVYFVQLLLVIHLGVEWPHFFFFFPYLKNEISLPSGLCKVSRTSDGPGCKLTAHPQKHDDGGVVRYH